VYDIGFVVVYDKFEYGIGLANVYEIPEELVEPLDTGLVVYNDVLAYGDDDIGLFVYDIGLVLVYSVFVYVGDIGPFVYGIGLLIGICDGDIGVFVTVYGLYGIGGYP